MKAEQLKAQEMLSGSSAFWEMLLTADLTHDLHLDPVLYLVSFPAVLQVSISLNKVELSVGESKFFTCTAIGEPVSINWFSPQGERIISNQRVIVHTEGVRSRLTIYNAIIEDAGIYRCQAVDAKGQSQEATVVLEIYQKLTFREVKTPQEFRQAEDAEVICDVISSPVPAVSWFYKNREITSEPNSRFQVLPSNNLQILRVSKADEGVYRCEARVEARGEIDFRDIVVLVNVPPVLSVPQQSFNATADYQESVTFTCITSGSPDPQVTWYWKGHVIERSEQYVLNTMDGGKSTLTIKNIRQGDGGPYTCRSSNKAGSTESQLFLKVFVQPHITQLRNVTAVEGSAAMISCTAEGEPLPEISWRRASDGQTFTDGDKSQDGRVEVRGRHGKSMLTISGVRLSDWGRFDCEALSRIGGHQKSMFLDIEYAPKFQTNQSIFYSWEGNPVNISCDVRSNPPATMLWRRDRFTISSQGTSNIRIHTAEGRSLLEVTPVSDRDFGRYNCTARNNIGARYQEFILAQADVPSNPYSVRLTAVSQRLATVTFMKPDSHGGVPISYYIINYKDTSTQDWRTVRSHGVQTAVVLASLEPNTTYEVRVAAVNGKGQGEFSHTETFQTLPIREPSPPTVHGQRGVGKAYRLGLIKQDDGGMPIVEYIVKYKTDKEEQWMTKLVPGMNDFALLQPLQWNTRYNVEITARNVKGLSEPTFFQFLMPQKPDITDSLFSGLGLGAVVGLGVAALLLLLVLVDVCCFFLRQCGLLMCITRKLCSKKTTTSGKSKELEEGKAAYLVDGSKEPIVGMRSEEERIANKEDCSPVHEPNETTPLTEPEKLPLKEENGKEVLKPDLIEIKVHTDNSIHTKQDDSKA
ncbi:neural cell adhesion molecule 2-like [Ctenopharyngodon idella]|uniref:neural cell adhesion molecule 2-like n=1 Tax=Ctenopharyngodon idella TaxID=7959 RepID=UPI00223070AB|nr:neural cell adhesion molecule 2-like [Ctenopharyngodon idella]